MRRPRHYWILWGAALGVAFLMVVTAGRSSVSAQPPSDFPQASRIQIAQADQANPASQNISPDTDALWQEVRKAMKQGQYREAFETLEVIEAKDPGDPWVALYRKMVQGRLGGEDVMARLSKDNLDYLRKRLKEEAQVQGRNARQAKALERTIRREQKKWKKALDQKQEDQESAALERERRAQRLRKEEARRVADAEKDRRRQKRQAAESKEAPASAGETTAAVIADEPQTLEAVREAEGEGVELAPIQVSTAERRKTQGPRLQSKSPEPGAVEINALQMNVLQDRSIAIAKGDVEVLYGDTRLTCQELTLFTDTHDAYMEGDVRVESGDAFFRAEMAHFNLDTKKGRYLEGTASSPPWHEYGRWSEQLAEDVFLASSGYLTSCDHVPPHFKFANSQAIMFKEEGRVRARNVALIVDQLPILYTPWMVFANNQSPFYIYPGKKKPWGYYSLMGYRYEVQNLLGLGRHEGALRADWRENTKWGFGVDDKFVSEPYGEGLLRLYFNEHRFGTEPPEALPKGADKNRYRALFRHTVQPQEGTSILTNFQKYSDANFQDDILFRDEFVKDDIGESFVSAVTSTPQFSVSGLARKRVNRFQTVTEAFPDAQVDFWQRRIGESNLFSKTVFRAANLQTVTAHSEIDTDVVQMDALEELNYALNWFRPIEVTPSAVVRQTYHTKDRQGSDREGKRNVISGQFSTGTTASLKLFRVFNVATNALGLNINKLRHVLTPTVTYGYVHEPTVPSGLLSFPLSEAPSNEVRLGLENKLQTKRSDKDGAKHSDELARLLISVPYTFQGSGHDAGALLGDWAFDLETTPWPRVRMEMDWTVSTHRTPGKDVRIPTVNTDLIVVSAGEGAGQVDQAKQFERPESIGFYAGADEGEGRLRFLPHPGQWYLGLGHRYSHNDKTESVLELDWRLSEKWQLGSFHRYDWKEVSGGLKRFENMREYQYTLRRDMHDWVGELVYRVDREFGEELSFVITMKALPELPIGSSESYHQPKRGSQSSAFSPVAR